jgi:hypothetical protein
MVAISHYIIKDRSASRKALQGVSFAALVGSDKIQRFRLSLLFLVVWVLVRLPWLPVAGRMFYARWHASRAFGAAAMDATS